MSCINCGIIRQWRSPERHLTAWSLPHLLPRHSDVDSMFGRDKVVQALRRFVDGQLYLLDLATESIAARAVILGDRGSTVLADVTPVIGGEDHRLCHWDRPFADLLAVHIERDLSTFAKAAAGVGKF